PALPPAVTPPEPASPQIKEIIPQAEEKRLRDEAASRSKDARQIVDQLNRRQLSREKKEVVNNINSFLASSEEAANKGDWRLAEALAERAQVLARDLLNAK